MFRGFRQPELGLSVLGVVNLIAIVVAGGTALWFALGQQTVWVLVVYYGLREFVAVIGYVAVSPQYSSCRFSPAVRLRLVDFAKVIIATKTMEDVGERGDDYLIGVLGSTAALGAYSVAWRLARGYTSILQPASSDGILPTFSRLEAGSDRSRRGIVFISRLQIHLSVPVYIAAFFAAPTAIPLLFGPEWRPAIPIFRALSVAAILFSRHATAKQSYYARGRLRVVLGSQIASIGTMIVAMLTLVSVYGGLGGTLAVEAMLAVGVLFLFWRLRRDEGVAIGKTALLSVVGALVAFGVGTAGHHISPPGDPVAALLGYVPLGIAVAGSHALVVLALYPGDFRDDLVVVGEAVFN